jgi:small subunit ribosomal protein S18
VRKDDDDDRGPRRNMGGPAGKDARGRGRRRRKVSFLTINKIRSLDYKDTNLLRRFVNEQGKMVSSRQTGTTAKEQRMVAKAVRRAREMALMPFVALDSTVGSIGGRFDRRGPSRYQSGPPREYTPRPQQAESPAPAPQASPEPQPEPTAE